MFAERSSACWTPPSTWGDAEIGQLKREHERLADDPGKTRIVIKIQGSSQRCWVSSLPATPRPDGAKVTTMVDTAIAKLILVLGVRRACFPVGVGQTEGYCQYR